MSRDLEPWGGEVRTPRWLRRLLRRPDSEDTEERAHERHQPAKPHMTRGEAADRAAAGPLTDLYQEGRQARQARKGPRSRG